MPRLSFLIKQREIGYPRSHPWPELLDVRNRRLNPTCRGDSPAGTNRLGTQALEDSAFEA
jgi:hypothetical protein